MQTRSSVLFLGLVGCTAVGESTADLSSTAATSNGNLSGAIFTTTADGSRVDANIYAAKADVYLDGGPGNSAPSGAAALPAGDYYFQVTDPSGHTLLSQDAVECRRVRISTDGVIVATVPGPGGCQHATGIDQDHASLGAITVQLMPYADTPNHGGEYKAWMTPVGDLGADGAFVNRDSKTDNFKVRTSTTGPVCGNGIVETGEQCDDGNTVGDDGCSATCQTETPPPPPPPCCGNGIVEEGEQCDDGNTSNGDGCSSTCQIEAPLPPPAVCGNGIVEFDEQCDDGNTVDGDGCDSTCHLEVVCTQITSTT